MGQSEQERYRIIPVEKITELGHETSGIAELIPDINFCGFSAYIFLLSSICKELGHSLPQSSFAGDCWSYIDGGCCVIVGAKRIALPEHEPIANRVRGTSSILSGGQLIWLTAIGLGPIGFAAGVGNSFVQSLYDTAKTLRRMRDDKYWLEDAQNELVYIQQELQKIIKDINKLQKEQGPNSANRMANWLIKKNECRQRELQEKHDRLSIHIKSYNDPKAKQKTYEEDLQKELANNLYNNLMFGTVFVGLVLLCLPGTQLAAILLISIAVGMFLYKHRPTSGNEFNAFKNIVDTKIETSAEPKNVGSDDDEGESTSFLDDDGLNF